MNDEIKNYLSGILDELKNQSHEDSNDPTLRRVEQFFKDFAQFVVEGQGTDLESERLEREIEWLKANQRSFGWPSQFPNDLFDRFVKILRAETPKYKRLMAQFMEDHHSFTMTGRGDVKTIRQQIDTLKRLELLSESDATFFYETLVPSDVERELARLANPPWWKRLFG